MENIILSREELVVTYKNGESLQEVVRNAEKEFWEQGKVICSIYLDDVMIDRDSLLKVTSSDYNVLKVNVEDISVLVRDTICSTQEHIKKVCVFTEKTLEKYLGEDYNAALKDFVDIIDNGKYIYESILLINEQHQKLYNKDVEPIKKFWLELEVKFMKMLTELTSSFNTEDYVLQADVLEYEFLGVLNDCYTYLDGLNSD
jgi:hypothetical protein